MNRLQIALIPVILLSLAMIARAQSSTAPAAPDFTPVRRTIRLNLLPGAQPTDCSNIADVITVIMDSVVNSDEPAVGTWECATNFMGSKTQTAPHGWMDRVRFDSFDPDTNAVTFTLTESGPNSNHVLDQTIARLRQLVANAPHQLSAVELHQRLKKIDDAFAAAKDELQKLRNIVGTRDEVMAGLMKDKMQALALEKQQIEIDLRAKQARAAAVRQQIKELSQQATTQASTDPVTEELRKAVTLQEEAIKMVKAKYKAGVQFYTDVIAAESALAAARTKLAEREEALRQATNGQLVQRLASDLVMTSIDETELKAKLAEVISLLPPSDIMQITQQQVDRLSAAYHPKILMHYDPPLAIELGRQQQDLQSQRLGLLVNKIEVLNPTTQP